MKKNFKNYVVNNKDTFFTILFSHCCITYCECLLNPPHLNGESSLIYNYLQNTEIW